MATNEETIRAFIEAWSRLDPEEISSFFTEDGVYHNMPTDPIIGRENVKRMITGFIASWTHTDWEILNLLSAGEIVIVERVDRTRAGEKLPARRVDLRPIATDGAAHEGEGNDGDDQYGEDEERGSRECVLRFGNEEQRNRMHRIAGEEAGFVEADRNLVQVVSDDEISRKKCEDQACDHGVARLRRHATPPLAPLSVRARRVPEEYTHIGASGFR